MPKYEYMLLRWHKPNEWWVLDPSGEKTKYDRHKEGLKTLTQVLGEYGGYGWEVVNYTNQETATVFPNYTSWPSGWREVVLMSRKLYFLGRFPLSFR